MHVVFVDRAGAKSIWELMGHIAQRIIKQGGRATFVMWDDAQQQYGQDVPEGISVITIRVPPKLQPWDLISQHWVFVQEFMQLLRQLRPDVVHTNFAVPSIVARWVATRGRVPLIVSTQHELCSSMRMHYRWGLRFTQRYCGAVAYVSNTVARSFGCTPVTIEQINTVPCPAHVVIPNGVDIAKIRTALTDAGTRVHGRIVCAGRMVPVKGQQLLIDALPEALHRHPHLQLYLIGAGPMEAELRRRVENLGLEDKVEFLGWQAHDEVLRQMAVAELVVVPSDGSQEGFGLVVAEALVCGTPLLVSDIPVFREVLDGFADSGHFFSPGDSNALARVLTGFSFAVVGEPICVPVLPAGSLERLSADAMADTYTSLYSDKLKGMHRE